MTIQTLLEGARYKRVESEEPAFFHEPLLYSVAAKAGKKHGYYCHAECERPGDITLRHLPRFHMVEVLIPGADLDAGVDLAMKVIAEIGGQNYAQLHAESREYRFDELVAMGEMFTAEDRTVTVDGETETDEEKRRLFLDMDSMKLALQNDTEAAHTPGCLLCVEGMPDEGATETAGKRVEIYCQVPNEAPLELANIYLHKGGGLPWPSIDIGVGVERSLMRARGVWDIAKVKRED